MIFVKIHEATHARTSVQAAQPDGDPHKRQVMDGKDTASILSA